MSKKRVVVGLSGGVDSSVAALLLKQKGYDVVGLFMKNWHDDSVTISKDCPWLEDSNDALIVANKLGIPFQTIDFSKAYKARIVDYMFSEYSNGRTPNPDVLCNREIKFDLFMKLALSLDADYVATGHYCQKKELSKDGEPIYSLLAGEDQNKDQSYFLCQLSQEQLAKALFPIGHLVKSEVRELAAKHGLVTAEKKDSQGLCFVGKVKLPEFLKQQLLPKTGNIVEIPNGSGLYNLKTPLFSSPKDEYEFAAQKIRYKETDGTIIGQHSGAHYFTIGQRKGLHVGGKSEPLFVIDTDTTTNTLYVGKGKSHKGLYRKALQVGHSSVNLIRPDIQLKNGESIEVNARIRYRQPLQKAKLHQCENALFVVFEAPQSAITSGQFVAWYIGKELIGSGAIV